MVEPGSSEIGRFGQLKRKIAHVLHPESQQIRLLEDNARSSPSYRRLKDKFAIGGTNVREQGLSQDSLTVGNLFDVVALHLLAYDNGFRGSFGVVKEIARDCIKRQPVEEQAPLYEQLASFIDSTHDTLPEIPPDLGEFVVDLKEIAESDTQHYLNSTLGKLSVVKKISSPDTDPRFTLITSNTSDRPHVARLFQEVGLPLDTIP